MQFRTESLPVRLLACSVIPLFVLSARAGKVSGETITVQSRESLMNAVQPLATTSLPTATRGIPPSAIPANLFGDPAPVPTKPGSLLVESKQAAKPVVESTPPLPDPTVKYIVTGVVESEEGRYALIEDRKTREGRFGRLGDSVDGFVVTDIDAGGLRLRGEAGGGAIAMNEKYDLTPLDRDAPYLGGRITKHGEYGAAEQFAAILLPTPVSLDLMGTLDSYIVLRGGEVFKKLNSEAFEGKLPLKEYHDRVNAAQPVVTNSLVVSYTRFTDDISIVGDNLKVQVLTDTVK